MPDNDDSREPEVFDLSELTHSSADVTRYPCTSPAQVMQLVAKLCGGTLGLGIDGDGRLPEMRMTFGCGRASARLSVRPVLSTKTRKIVIEVETSWPDESTYDPAAAALAAAVITMATQKALLAQSVAIGRSWKGSEVFR